MERGDREDRDGVLTRSGDVGIQAGFEVNGTGGGASAARIERRRRAAVRARRRSKGRGARGARALPL
jgi:hypothetical protein